MAKKKQVEEEVEEEEEELEESEEEEEEVEEVEEPPKRRGRPPKKDKAEVVPEMTDEELENELQALQGRINEIKNKKAVEGFVKSAPEKIMKLETAMNSVLDRLEKHQKILEELSENFKIILKNDD